MQLLLFLVWFMIPHTLCIENTVSRQWNPLQTYNSVCRCGIGSSSKQWSQRIAGGYQVISENEYPWQAVIKRYYQFICSGALITESYVVTAASCFFSFVGNRIPNHGLRVGIGIYRLLEDNTNRPYVQVDKIIIHRYYDPRPYVSDLENNIALLRLRHPPNFSGIQPVCLPSPDSSNILTAKAALITGWGSKRTTGTLNNILQEVVVQTKNQCTSGTPSTVFCIDASPGKGVCKGDIGSPVMVEENGVKVLIGVTITDATCGLEESKFTSVFHFLTWIKSHVGDSEACLENL